MDARKARERGAPLFGYFLSGTREKVTRPSQEDESFAFQRVGWVSAMRIPTSTTMPMLGIAALSPTCDFAIDAAKWLRGE